LRIDFHQPVAAGAQYIHRTHPLVSALADHLLETALDERREPEEIGADAVARAGAIFTETVDARTAVLLIRLRHQLTVTHRGKSQLLLCEEALAVGVSADDESNLLDDATARELMAAEPARNMPRPLRDQHLQRALDQLPGWQPALEDLARTRAQLLLEDHRRVREASGARGEYRVTPSLPVDLMGVFVLIPA
jgi:serine/threonine protein phosphatase PrpC